MDRGEMRKRWTRLCDRLGVYLADPGEEFQGLEDNYSRPRRAYHNLDHVGFCLSEFDRISFHASHPVAVELAIWWHDASYDAESTKNEERSAEFLASFCDRAGVLPEVREISRKVILYSKHSAPATDSDTMVFADADLAILGQPPEAFWVYEKAVAEEYRWVSRDIFRAKRAEILDRFLARSTIYCTGIFRELYEKAARENLRASIDALRAG
jgi:predicted metal-dependent HD superfamily phosphohydrolase